MAAEKKEQQKRSGYWTPAAILAAEAGEKTYTVNIAKRYKGDNARSIQVDDHPHAVVPTEEDVEVCEAEYYELKRSAALRKETNKMIEKLERETGGMSGAL